MTFKEFSKWKYIAKPKILRPTLIMGVLRFISGLTFIWTLSESLNTTLIAAAGGVQAVLTVILAAFLLKERANLYIKSIAAILACVGVFIMFYS